jgi:MFS transporter, PHS family, inorganic phosphate transporter
MLQYRLYNGQPLPPNLEGFMKAGANIGSVIGQFLFGEHQDASSFFMYHVQSFLGYLADSLGRKAVYGKELMLIILATILCLTTPTGQISPDSCLIYLGMFRILLGVGVGGDYPMSASVTSDRANLRKRGTLLAYIFSNQGWGSFLGSVITIIVLEAYKHVMNTEGKTSKVDGVWRIIIGVSLVPAFGTLYQRLTMPESQRFKASKNLEQDDSISELKKANERTEGLHGFETPSSASSVDQPPKTETDGTVDVSGVKFNANESPEAIATKKEQAHFGGTYGISQFWLSSDHHRIRKIFL